jgi:hypothetical protein
MLTFEKKSLALVAVAVGAVVAYRPTAVDPSADALLNPSLPAMSYSGDRPGGGNPHTTELSSYASEIRCCRGLNRVEVPLSNRRLHALPLADEYVRAANGRWLYKLHRLSPVFVGDDPFVKHALSQKTEPHRS